MLTPGWGVRFDFSVIFRTVFIFQPASPMTWGEQTDVPESADWYNSSYIIAWGSNVP
ncbi:molybdopterin-dependent oxidoreductase, partial [Escherichia coli]|nr:molybdopterin-dependent oxidoreductase [Escherichia coli]